MLTLYLDDFKEGLAETCLSEMRYTSNKRLNLVGTYLCLSHQSYKKCITFLC